MPKQQDVFVSFQLLSNLKETDITDDSDASMSSQHSTMYNFKQVDRKPK